VTWLSKGNFNQSSAGKRFKRCAEFNAKKTAREKTTKERNAKNNPINNAKKKARRLEERKMYDLANYPLLDLSDEELDAAADRAIATFDASLEIARTCSSSLAVNVFGASSGSRGYTIKLEGEKSVLTTRGYDTPAIVAKTDEGGIRAGPRGAQGVAEWCERKKFYWRALDPDERRAVGTEAIELHCCGASTALSRWVESAVQRHVDELVTHDHTLKKLWRVTGAGAPQGTGPYKVGARFFATDGEGASMRLKAPGPYEFTF